MVLSPQPVDYTGIERPQVVIALADEGVGRRKQMLARLDADTLVIKAAGVTLPDSGATVQEVDFKARKIKSQDWALAGLALLATSGRVISMEMLKAALAARFSATILETAEALVDRLAEPTANND
jgi:hypothetical protein